MITKEILKFPDDHIHYNYPQIKTNKKEKRWGKKQQVWACKRKPWELEPGNYTRHWFFNHKRQKSNSTYFTLKPVILRQFLTFLTFLQHLCWQRGLELQWEHTSIPLAFSSYLLGSYWDDAVLLLPAAEEDSPLLVRYLALGWCQSECQEAVAALSLGAASVLAGGSVEAPREAGNGTQLAAAH